MSGRNILEPKRPMTQSAEAVKTSITTPEGTELVLPKYPALLPIAEINKALGDLQPLISRIAELKKDILVQESEVLKAILKKITLLVPFLSKDYEQCYRRKIVILENTQRIKFEGDAVFFSEHQLILYENGALVDQHRYGENTTSKRIGWELISETRLTPTEVITAFGLEVVSEGLIKMIKEVLQIYILKEELESKLDDLVNVLGDLQ